MTSWGNYLLSEATWVSAGPFNVESGPVELNFQADEGDGRGWPDNTNPIYVSAFQFAPLF